MTPRTLFLAGAMIVALSLTPAVAPPVGALERGPYSIEILVDGVPLDEYAARGTTYVEALEGREYSVRLSNHTARRIAVALSVDGLNTIDAKTSTARDASKWILGPHETITLDGWQTSSSVARRFFFTTEEKSYGAWLGKTTNLGIVSAAVFREKRRRPVPIQRPPTPGRREPAPSSAGEAAPSAPELRSRPADGSERSRREEAVAPEPEDDYAATGIGRAVDHRVRRVRFEAEERPAATLEIRYEYRDALVRLGVLPQPFAFDPDPLRRRERARGFQEPGFAPDPYR